MRAWYSSRVPVAHSTVVLALSTLLRANSTALYTPKCVAFCGTATARDLAYDLHVAKCKHPLGGRVHAGFLRRYDAIATSRRSTARVVTGFSLGSAMAALYAVDMLQRGQRIDHVILFASPRIGDDEFAKRYDALLGARTTRFQHAGDPIVRLPPRRLGYAHIGRPVTLHFDTPNVFNHDVRGYDRALGLQRSYEDVVLRDPFA